MGCWCVDGVACFLWPHTACAREDEGKTSKAASCRTTYLCQGAHVASGQQAPTTYAPTLTLTHTHIHTHTYTGANIQTHTYSLTHTFKHAHTHYTHRVMLRHVMGDGEGAQSVVIRGGHTEPALHVVRGARLIPMPPRRIGRLQTRHTRVGLHPLDMAHTQSASHVL